MPICRLIYQWIWIMPYPAVVCSFFHLLIMIMLKHPPPPPPPPHTHRHTQFGISDFKPWMGLTSSRDDANRVSTNTNTLSHFRWHSFRSYEQQQCCFIVNKIIDKINKFTASDRTGKLTPTRPQADVVAGRLQHMRPPQQKREIILRPLADDSYKRCWH